MVHHPPQHFPTEVTARWLVICQELEAVAISCHLRKASAAEKHSKSYSKTNLLLYLAVVLSDITTRECLQSVQRSCVGLEEGER